MYYAIAAICVSLMIIVLVGKPIRIEIIHTVAGMPEPPPDPTVDTKNAKEQGGVPEALQAMAHMNELFHNVSEEKSNG